MDSDDSSSTTTTKNNSSDAFLKHLSTISHKISKPNRRPPVYDNRNLFNSHLINDVQAQQSTAAQNLQPPPPPPVYNINKSDFRDVVQKLTGSPAHERISTPPPVHQPKPPSSRLQRIRPPPLAQIGNRPPPLNTVGGGPPVQTVPNNGIPVGGGFVDDQRHVQAQPVSPLPPLPAVHAAAESPISAYMRFLRGAAAIESDPKRLSGGPSSLAPHGPAPQQPPVPPPPQPSAATIPLFPAFPSSPLPFGCLPSPRSPYALLSPTGQLPLSPTVPVPSPNWKGI